MSNKSDTPLDTLRDTLFKRLAEDALLPMSLPVRMYELKDRIQDALISLMLDHEENLDALPPDVQYYVVTHMLDLIALEVAVALLVAADNDEFEVAVGYATETITSTIIKEFKSTKAAREAVEAEFYEEWRKTNPAPDAKPAVSKAKPRKDLQ